MKVSQPKRSRWVYISLVVMLLALLAFSLLPLVSSIIESRQPRSGTASLSAGISQAEMSKLASAALGYQMVLEREPENQNALRGLLQVKLQQGDLEGAIAPLERLAQLNPQDGDYLILLAQAKQQVKDYTGAALAYRPLLDSDPSNMRALKGMVDLLLLQNRSQDAIAMVQNSFAKAVEAKSQQEELTSLQLILAEIYGEQKRFEDAIAVYDQTMKTNPEDFRPFLAKALVLEEQGKGAEAKSLFKQATSLAPIQYKEQIKVLASDN